MRHLRLTENAPPVPFELTPDEAEALANCELAVVSRTPGSRDWDVAAGTKVGVARIGELQVTVQPKIPLDRLVFLMGYARRPSFWRDQSVLLDPEADLSDALADSFARQAVRALQQGVLHGYQPIDDSVSVLRGRVRVSEQISRRFGLGLPLEVSYDDFTVDIAENRLLLGATLQLLRMPGISRAVRTSLQRLRLQLADVTGLVRGEQLPRWIPSRLNVRYQPALHLADLILAGDSFEQRVGDLQVSGYVLDMWRVFEDFVCAALSEAIAPFGGRSDFQYDLRLDRAGAVPMRPDFVWTRIHRVAAVVDAKYKAEKYSGFPQADLYQLLAYCTVLGLTDGHLVYAKGNEDERRHLVAGTDVTIRCHTLDLADSPAGILAQIAGLADLVHRSSLRLGS